MAIIKPFRAIRPPRDKAHLVASRSYISYSEEHLRDKLRENPYTFIQVINPEQYLGLDSKVTGLKRLPLVKQVFEDFKARGFLHQDEKKSFYLYRQTQAEFSFTGIIGGASVAEYDEGKIKKHENTITHREELFKSYLEICDFNAEPVLLTHPDHEDIRLIFDKYLNARPEYEFTTTDTIKHEVWVINEPIDIQLLQKAYGTIPALYIADGHHRSASSALLGREKRNELGNPNHSLASDYYMSCLIPQSELKIFPFFRGLRSFPHSKSAFLDFLKSKGSVRETSIFKVPTKRNEFGFQWGNDSYLWEVNEEFIPLDHPVQRLAPQILHDQFLHPFMGIEDPKNDPNLTYFGGPKSLEETLQHIQNEKIELGISVASIPVEEVMEVADAGGVMPPKSTWVEPKLRSGMLVYSISEW